MKYKVITEFTDLQDNNHYYQKNDYYPHAGKKLKEIPKERIQELSTKNNKRNMILIEAVEEEKTEEKKDEAVEKKK